MANCLGIRPFTFVGKWGVRQEGASGALYQMRARYYDATTARFLSSSLAVNYLLWEGVGSYLQYLTDPNRPEAVAYRNRRAAEEEGRRCCNSLREYPRIAPKYQKEHWILQFTRNQSIICLVSFVISFTK